MLTARERMVPKSVENLLIPVKVSGVMLVLLIERVPGPMVTYRQKPEKLELGQPGPFRDLYAKLPNIVNVRFAMALYNLT